MAESADILSPEERRVILPNLEAGCSMADMAKADDVEACWQALQSLGIEGIVPITYMNSAASLKAFCGRNGGIVCTSINAPRVFDWAFERGEKILFFPDEHLGRNTGIRQGISEEKMIVWDPFQPLGGNSPEQLRDATVILWKGYCSVHARFSVEQIEGARAAYPDVNVIVHPECRLEVVQASDYDGSTEFIIDTIVAAPAGTTWAVGTEINLVNRLQNEMPDKRIFCLDPVICPCSTMYRVHPAYLLWVLSIWLKATSSTRSRWTRTRDRMLWSRSTACSRSRSVASARRRSRERILIDAARRPPMVMWSKLKKGEGSHVGDAAPDFE